MTAKRDTVGRFVPGTAPGPGRRPAATERSYLAGMRDAVSLADWTRIVEAAVLQALGGDPVARAWITNTLLGKNPPPLSRIADDPPPELSP